MQKHYTEKELKEKLDGLALISDSRENVNGHIVKYFESKNVPIISRKLDVGDYSCQIGDITFERSFVVERKANLDEICGNLTSDRNRFEREFLRAKAFGVKVFLVIENATWSDVYLQNYRSKLSAKSLLASLLSWQTRFNVTILFCEPQNTAKLIHGILYYAAREELLGGTV